MTRTKTKTLEWLKEYAAAHKPDIKDIRKRKLEQIKSKLDEKG